MNPDRAEMAAALARYDYAQSKREAQRAQSRAAQPKRKNNRKARR